jgi:hypothetical protein
MRAHRTPEAFLPHATDELMILIALAHRARHGCAIIQDVEARSRGIIAYVATSTNALQRS